MPMIPVQDLCDCCAEHKAHFEMKLAKPLTPEKKIVVGDLLFPRAGYLCPSCASRLCKAFPDLYVLTELKKL